MTRKKDSTDLKTWIESNDLDVETFSKISKIRIEEIENLLNNKEVRSRTKEKVYSITDGAVDVPGRNDKRDIDSKEYQILAWIKSSCYNINHSSYASYGARGIKVAPSWLKSFLNFKEDMGPIPQGKTGIELIDMNKHFCKENCRWVSRKERRPHSEMPNFKNRKKMFVKPKAISLVVEHEYFEHLVSEKNKINPEIAMNSFLRNILENYIPFKH